MIRALRRSGIFVDPMEDWTAASDEPKVFSADRVKGCHFCILLVGLRRGYVAPGETSSITQLEYEAAVANGLDVLVYMLDEKTVWPTQFNELDSDPQVRAWRAHLQQTHGRELFDADPSSIEVLPAIFRWKEKHTHPVVSNLSDFAGVLLNHETALRNRKAQVTVYLERARDLIKHAHDELEQGRVPHGTCQAIFETGNHLVRVIGNDVSSEDLTRLKELLQGAYKVEILHDALKDAAARQVNLAELDRTRGSFAALVDAISFSP